MNRKDFLRTAGTAPVAVALAARLGASDTKQPAQLALVTADLESHVVAFDLRTMQVVRRIRTGPGPRSIESSGGRVALVAHTQHGVVSLIAGSLPSVRDELDAFAAPRYTAMHPGGEIGYVSDSASEEVVAVDLRGHVVWRTHVPGPARHISISPDGRVLWTSLGSRAQQIAVLDSTEPRRLRFVRTFDPPFLAHDVVFAPDGERVWVTSGSERRVALYRRGALVPHAVIASDAPPQHVAFAHGDVFVASGDDGTVRRHALGGKLLGRARVPLDSYNVTFGSGSVVTPSLARGTVSVLDIEGRVRTVRRVARAAHDACVLSTKGA